MGLFARVALSTLALLPFLFFSKTFRTILILMKISTSRKYLGVVIPIVFIISVTAMTLCLLYCNRHWNAEEFETFYKHWDFFIAYLIESVSLALAGLCYLLLKKSRNVLYKKIFSIFSLAILCIGSIAVIVTLAVNSIVLNHVIKDCRLDCQLKSRDKMLFLEAIDSLIPRCYYHDPFEEPNSFIRRAARDGYPKAQNAMGCFFHQRALVYKSDHNIDFAKEDFEHAIFWFIKAAQNNFAVSQTNLGRIYMGNIDSNNSVDNGIAKQWLIKAIRNGDNDAYYYLGEIYYSVGDLRNAYIYWQKGAKSGNEDCANVLEKPEFAYGIPANSSYKVAAPLDSI